MRDALAHLVVDRDERSLCVHRPGHHLRKQARVGEQRADQIGGQLGKRLDVHLRHEQAVAGKEGADVEERHRVLVLENDVRGRAAGRDVAEGAHALSLVAHPFGADH
jgi:hypothetical protein